MFVLWGRRREGSISVFLAMTLLLVMSIFFVLAEGLRMMAIKKASSFVSDNGGDCLESMYLLPLWEKYKITAIDASLGSSNLNIPGLEEKVMNNLRENGDPEGEEYINFLRTTPEDCSINEYGLLTDNNGAPFVKLAVRSQKERLAGAAATKIMDMVKDNEFDIGDGADLAGDIKKGEDALKNFVEGNETESEGEETGTDTEVQKYPEMDWSGTENPMDTAKKYMGGETLKLYMPAEKSPSDSAINTANLLSNRKYEVSGMPADSVGAMDRILFDEYLMTYFSRYGREFEDSSLKYELEYILGGRESDAENLKSVIKSIMLFRETENAAAIYANPDLNLKAGSLATAIVGFTLNPFVVEAVKAGIIAGWAYVESILDIRTILDGKKVPLMKSSADWTSDLKSLPSALSGGLEARSVDVGLGYDEYIRILLFMKNDSAIRTMDLIENSLRKEEGLENLRMDRMIYRADMDMKYEGQRLFPIFTELDTATDSYEHVKNIVIDYLS